MYKDLKKNIDEIQSTTKNTNLLELPNSVRTMDKLKYLLYSLTKSLVDIGHSIILENDLRDPLNRADIFISLAEQKIVESSIVPGVKKAVLALSKIDNYKHSEILEIISESIAGLNKCLDAFVVYFDLRDKNI